MYVKVVSGTKVHKLCGEREPLVRNCNFRNLIGEPKYQYNRRHEGMTKIAVMCTRRREQA